MCGIAGIIDFRGRPIDPALLHRFNTCLAHRGPDDRGIWLHQADGFSAGFAHTRLAVIDPTPEGQQPMSDAAGRFVVTYNGELYNYRTLRGQISTPGRTQSDTEVVLHALSEWGPDALRRLDGMWAIGFLDRESRTGLISRDPVGIKPLYYAIHDGRLIFASELRAIAQIPDLPLELDPDALDIYLHLGFIPHPYSIYRSIRKLPPGHLIRFDGHGAGQPERFFHLDSPGSANQAAARSCPDYADAVQQLREQTIGAVQSQLVSDVPLGAFLSGGLDSSIVVACMTQPGSPPARTFSIGYADHPRYDETQYARSVANHFGTKHHEFRLTFRDILDTIEPVLSHLGEPFADSSLLPTAIVSRFTREHVTVALSGDGGDELFGGYWRYLAHGYLKRYERLPFLMRKGVIEPLLRRVPSARSTRWLDRLRQARKLLRAVDAPGAIARHLAWARWLDPITAPALLGPERARAAWERISQLYGSAPAATVGDPRDAPTPEDLQGVLLADLAIGLPADMLFKVDTASMMHGLEVRVPLLARELVGFAASLPVEYKIHRGTGKRILRDAFRDVLPPDILSRRKMGFEVPVGEFLRHELRDLYASMVTRDTLASLGLDPGTAKQLYDAHLHRREDHADLLWSLMTLCHWHQNRSSLV